MLLEVCQCRRFFAPFPAPSRALVFLAGDKTGDLLKNLAEEVQKITQKDNEAEAKSFLDHQDNLAKKLELQQKLAEIALQETEEQNRAKAEAKGNRR